MDKTLSANLNWLMLVPFRLVKYFTFLPFRLTSEFADAFIVQALKKFNLNKEEAKDYAKKLAIS